MGAEQSSQHVNLGGPSDGGESVLQIVQLLTSTHQLSSGPAGDESTLPGVSPLATDDAHEADAAAATRAAAPGHQLTVMARPEQFRTASWTLSSKSAGTSLATTDAWPSSSSARRPGDV
jgi:hypothetical protein